MWSIRVDELFELLKRFHQTAAGCFQVITPNAHINEQEPEPRMPKDPSLNNFF